MRGEAPGRSLFVTPHNHEIFAQQRSRSSQDRACALAHADPHRPRRPADKWAMRHVDDTHGIVYEPFDPLEIEQEPPVRRSADPPIQIRDLRRFADASPLPPLPAPAPVPKLDLAELERTPGGFLFPAASGHRIASVHEAGELDLPITPCPPPSRSLLEKLEKAEKPTLFLGRVVSTALENKTTSAYAVILPPHFDIKRAEPYSVHLVALPRGAGLQDLMTALARTKIPERRDTVVVIPDTAGAAANDPLTHARETAEAHVLDCVQTDFNIDFRRYSVQSLGHDRTVWARDIAEVRGQNPRLNGPVVYTEQGWRHLPPTRNWERPFPARPSVHQTVSIPEAFQRQPLDHGTYFVPVAHEGLFSGGRRLGVYLPPGYDPASKERYPILLMLPGANNPLHYWTSAGQMITHLDKMMRGDGKKMIVVIPDGNGNGPSPERCVRYAAEKLKGDDKRISVLGISMGASRAWDFAKEHSSRTVSVSLHSGMLWGVGRAIPREAKIYVDAGKDEGSFLRDSVRFTQEVRSRGGDVTLKVFESRDLELKHRWSSWELYIEQWIAFHQDAQGGKPGPASLRADVADIARQIDIAEERRGEEDKEQGRPWWSIFL